MRAKPANAPSRKPAGELCRCEILPHAMLRTPLRSYRRFLTLGAAAASSGLSGLTAALLAEYRDPLLRRALRAKSSSLLAALERHERDVTPLADDALLALHRYFVRVTTRCTPLMLFAGVGTVSVGEFTQAIQASEGCWQLGVFPSWHRILRITRELLQEVRTRHAVRYCVNETLLPHGGVLCFFTEQEPEGSQVVTPRYKVVCLREDPPLRPLLSEPGRSFTWQELVHLIQAAHPAATEAMAEEYLFSLIDGGVLLTSLQPPSIGSRPERHLHDAATELALPELALQSAELLRLTDQPLPVATPRFDTSWAALEQHPWLEAADAEPAASSAALRRNALSQAVLRIDARAGGLDRALVAQLGELVARTPGLWSHRYAVYRQAIAQHFAQGSIGRRIPLLELTFRVVKGPLPEDMLGTVALPVRSPHESPAPTLESYLTSQFLDADLAEEEQVELDLEALNQVVPLAPRWPSLPPVAEAILRCIQCRGRAALQHYSTTAHPGALLNRFLHWNAADPILAQLQQIWRLQEQLAQPALLAEITCGGSGRLRDIGQRPLTYRHQIVVHGSPSVAPAEQIPLHELSVYMSESGPTLWWERGGVPVRARQLSALSPQAFSPVVHVLLALSAEVTDWGLRVDERGLPVRTARLCYRDLVLRPQSWLLPPALRNHLQRPTKERKEAPLRALLDRWRKRYQVPRIVRLGDAERNAVDLDNPLGLRELEELVKAGGQRVFEEYFEADSPVVGDDGPLVAEAVVHLRLHAPPAASPLPPIVQPPPLQATLLETAAARSAHVFTPGSSWLFLKLYYGSGLGGHAETRQFIDDDLLGRFVAPLIGELEKAGQLYAFHFVRYADPESHLRLRFQPRAGSGLQLLELLRERLDAQVRSGAFARWVVATYEREADRYGGPELITTAEQLFTADSRLCLRALAAYHRDALAQERDLQMLLPVRVLYTLYRAFGYDLAARLACFTQLRSDHDRMRPLGAEAKAELDAKYRQHGRALQDMILSLEGRDAGSDAPLARRKDVAGWFRTYEQAVYKAAAVYHGAVARGACSRPLHDILASIYHMHCNRLLGALELEYAAIYLCQRAVQAVHARCKQAASP